MYKQDFLYHIKNKEVRPHIAHQKYYLQEVLI